MRANAVLSINALPRGQERFSTSAVQPDRRREQRLTFIILVIAGVARLPFLWHGFGGHPDEWLVVRSGLDFWLHGTYYPSRTAPGFPLNEVLMGGLAWIGGATACAVAATAASLITLVYMRGLAGQHGIRNSFWMVLAFSFEPWVWASGTHDLDYIWATGSLVAGFYYVERRRFGAAGLACAVGFGFRPSSLLWIGPLFIRILLVERRWQGVVRFVLWAVIPALIPTAMIVWAMVSRPDAYAHAAVDWTKWIETIKHTFGTASALAAYRLLELFGHLLALVIICAACIHYRDRLFGLLRSGESWVWIYVLVFACLLPSFVIESSKPEYMLPALPGLFMILGRSIGVNWWKAITVAFAIDAFVTFGFGHAPHAGGLRLELGRPTLLPGTLLWYAERAEASNDRVIQTGSELSKPLQIVRADPEMDRLDDFYVSSLLRRGPVSQARISCPLVPAFLSFPKDRPPELNLSNGLPLAPASHFPILICCQSSSGLVLSNTPSSESDSLRKVVQNYCINEMSASRTSSTLPQP